jgi:hypothetical protein
VLTPRIRVASAIASSMAWLAPWLMCGSMDTVSADDNAGLCDHAVVERDVR